MIDAGRLQKRQRVVGATIASAAEVSLQNGCSCIAVTARADSPSLVPTVVGLECQTRYESSCGVVRNPAAAAQSAMPKRWAAAAAMGTETGAPAYTECNRSTATCNLSYSVTFCGTPR